MVRSGSAQNPAFDLYQLSEELVMLRDTVRSLAEAKIAPFAAAVDEEARFPQEALDALRGADLHAVHVPETYGGAGADALATVIVIEEVARACVSSSLIPAVNKLGSLPVIAEDLGYIGPEVEALLEETGFPGMGVLQFGFLGDERHLPHRYDENRVAYTGTHDNTTLLAWMYEMREEDRNKALFYCGYEGEWGRGGPNCGICRTWIRELYLSKARMVVVPIQDLLGYGADTRTNIPGLAEGNWRFRVTQDALSQIDTGYYRRLAEVTDRL